MKQRYMIILTILLAAAVLSGCGGDYNGPKLGGTTTIDVTPPYIISTSPTNSATNVSLTATISVTFSEPMDTTTVTTGTFTLTGGPITVTGISWFGTTRAILNYTGSLAAATTYTATMTTGPTDQAGNPLLVGRTWSFTTTTVDIISPTVNSYTPTGTNVSIKDKIAVLFNEALQPGTVSASTFRVTAGSQISGSYVYTHPTATFTPAPALSSGTTYSVTLTSGIQDLAGNPLASTPYVWTFTTAPTPTITETSLPPGTQTGSYSYALSSSGGFGTKTWGFTGSLPSGLSLSSAGVLSSSNITQGPGSYNIDFTLTDQDGLVATKTLPLTIITGPLITTSSLSPATVSGNYNATLSASGGTPPYGLWNAYNLPGGMTFSTSTGTIGGAPTTAGIYDVGFTVRDSNLITSPITTLTLIVNDIPAVATTQGDLDLSSAKAMVGSPYTFTMLAGSGTGTLSWSANGLPLSGSLSIDTFGVISGTPLGGDVGPYNVGFTVTDANLVSSATTTLVLTVVATPLVTTTQSDLDINPATTGNPYTYNMLHSGGTGSVAWAWSSATALPPGLGLSAGGVISGTPSAAGTYNIDFTVTDTVYSVTSPTVNLNLTVN